MSFLGKLFGTEEVIKRSFDLVDEAFYTSSEEAKDKQKTELIKAKNKVDILKAYEPFKIAQRYLALMFASVFIFIMINGVLSSLYGLVPIENVANAKKFAYEMNLGDIMMLIIFFYFGGGAIESFKKVKGIDA